MSSEPCPSFSARHLVQLYETDLMGIVHHANYLRVLEEARVAWAHDKGLLDYQKPESASHLAVLECHMRHMQPAKFGDVLETFVQARLERIKIIFEYKCYCFAKSTEPFLEGRTVHVPLDLQLKAVRPPLQIRQLLEKEKWIETWLSNL